MKSIAAGAAALAFVTRDSEAFVVPATGLGSITRGASSTSRLPDTQRCSTPSATLGVAHGSGCSCFSCARGVHSRSCTCRSCSTSAVLYGRSHCAGCRCGACSVRMQAHPEGCGCGECRTSVGAFHGASCECGACSQAGGICAASCNCLACIGSGTMRTKRASASLTVMRMGGGGEASSTFRQRLTEEPDMVVFEDTMGAIADDFEYAPKRFVNGGTSSDAGSNEGSCKVFSFGKMEDLSASETLACFGEHYRSVVKDPSGDSHSNIRAFMKTGWDGVSFPDGLSLSRKEHS